VFIFLSFYFLACFNILGAKLQKVERKTKEKPKFSVIFKPKSIFYF